MRGSNTLTIVPFRSIAYGMSTSPGSMRPMAAVIALLPLPEPPYSSIDRPEFTAGPSACATLGDVTRCEIDCSTDSLLMRIARID